MFGYVEKRKKHNEGGNQGEVVCNNQYFLPAKLQGEIKTIDIKMPPAYLTLSNKACNDLVN